MPGGDGTDAHSADMALTDDQLSFLLQRLPDVVLVLDSKGCVRWANSSAERLWGQTLDSAIGLSALELLHPDDVEFVQRSLESIQSKDVGELIELRAKTPNGWRLLEVIGSRVPDVGHASIVFCVRDVTDRRRFEVAHGDVEKFRSILQNSAYVSMLVTPDRLVESVSSTLTRLLGHDPEAVEGTPLLDLFEPISRSGIDRALHAAAAQDAPASPVTVTASCPAYGLEQLVPVELTIVSLVGDPTLSGFVVSMRDLSELTKAEHEIREALSLLTATLESTADGLLVVDTEGRIVSFNKRFADMWLIPDEVLATRDDAAARDYVVAQLADPEAFMKGVKELYADREAESFDTLSFRDGRTFERYSKPQRVGDEIVGRVWSFRDVTERVNLERAAEEDHRRLAEAQNVARLGTFEWSAPNGPMYWSAPYRELIGVSSDEPPRMERFIECVHADDRERIRAGVADASRRSDGGYQGTFRVVLPTGEIRWLQTRTRGIFDSEGSLSKVIGTAIDVTDRQAVELARRDAEERFRLGFEHSAVPSAMLDLEGVATSVNQALCDFLGFSESELLGLNAVDFVHPDDRDYLATRVRVYQGDRTPLERRFRRQDGSYVHGLINMALVNHDDGTPAYVYAQVQDITARKRFEAALEHMAFHDPLTGLPNRALLQDRLQGALARSTRQGTRVAVIFADIDRFKLVNDTLGHAAGDRLLVDLADRLRSVTRACDTVGRFGGDEFVMICEGVDPAEGVDAIGRRMAAALDQPFRVAERELYLTLSAGIVLPETEEAGATCLRDGDVAMYRAKELGGARSELFSPEMLSPVAHRLDLETALHLAIETDEIRVAYQPIIDLTSGRPIAVEALCRWTHPRQGEISPSEFIRVAEQAGLIVPLGRSVTREAVRQITRWRTDLPGGEALTVSINVSSAEVSADLLDRCRQLNAEGAVPGSYHFEITESVFMSDADAAIDVLRQLDDLDVAVSIDDFGTGYSSLAYLRLLPVRSLKIDQSFVAGLRQDNPTGPSIVRAVVALAEALDMGSCAEGVETEEQRQALIDLGCHTGQGFLWAAPMLPAAFERWWQEQLVAHEATRAPA